MSVAIAIPNIFTEPPDRHLVTAKIVIKFNTKFKEYDLNITNSIIFSITPTLFFNPTETAN